MLEHLPLSTWIPIFTIALVFAAGGAAMAWSSLRAGQYRDPEAAKFEILGDDRYPDDAADTRDAD